MSVYCSSPYLLYPHHCLFSHFFHLLYVVVIRRKPHAQHLLSITCCELFQFIRLPVRIFNTNCHIVHICTIVPFPAYQVKSTSVHQLLAGTRHPPLTFVIFLIGLRSIITLWRCPSIHHKTTLFGLGCYCLQIRIL